MWDILEEANYGDTKNIRGCRRGGEQGGGDEPVERRGFVGQ